MGVYGVWLFLSMEGMLMVCVCVCVCVYVCVCVDLVNQKLFKNA